jgi:dynein heavy chain
LKKEHLVEIKSLGQPPKPVRVILGGVVILNIDTVRKNGGEIIIKNVEGQLTKKEEDYFETAKRFLLNDPKDLLEMLRTYDKDNINPAFIYKLEQRIMTDPDFNLERAKQCSFAVKFLYSWVRAMYDYNKVYIETRPLRDKLAHTRHILSEKTAFLNEKKAQLDECNRKIQVLQDLYNEKR